MSWFPLLYKSAHRVGLEAYITVEAPKTKGEVLDVGSKDRRYDHFFPGNVTACDIIEDKKNNVIAADIHKLPFAANHFETTACFEVLEYTHDPVLATNELLRVTKPGGTILLSIPFLTYWHDDMIRVTEHWFDQFRSTTTTLTVYPIGNAYTVIVDVLRRKILETKNRALRTLCYPLLWLLGCFLPKEPKTSDRRYATGYFVVITKKAT